MGPLLEHHSTVYTPLRRLGRWAKRLGPVPCVGLAALPLAAVAWRRADRAVRDDLKHGLWTSGGVHVVFAVFAFLVSALPPA